MLSFELTGYSPGRIVVQLLATSTRFSQPSTVLSRRRTSVLKDRPKHGTRRRRASQDCPRPTELGPLHAQGRGGFLAYGVGSILPFYQGGLKKFKSHFIALSLDENGMRICERGLPEGTAKMGLDK